MITLRKSQERGQTKIGWLDSKHSFSFGDYYDPKHESFGALRVINEDWIAGGGGFAPHGHRDMEIVTYLVDGALQHKDSIGGGGVIRPGEIQRMSAGRGIVHSEFNASRESTAHLLQIWITPSKSGLEPSYEQKSIDPEAVRNRFARIASQSQRARSASGSRRGDLGREARRGQRSCPSAGQRAPCMGASRRGRTQTRRNDS
jgi:redox-sensitive bicupin YhaK (pirin superfamily)